MAAFRTSSLILAVLEILLNLFTPMSLKSFSVSLHLNDLIIISLYDALRHSSILILDLRAERLNSVENRGYDELVLSTQLQN